MEIIRTFPSEIIIFTHMGLIIMYISNFTTEEFGANTHEPYISQKTETNLLNTFCNDTDSKISITSHVVNSLILSKSSSFTSTFHVKWAMEFLGYAFSLPIDNSEVITGAFDIYRKWLLEEDRPECIKQNENFYQQEIIGHLSLIFTKREGNSLVHSKLCKKVLLLIKEMTDKKKLSQETWKFLLKIMLLISNTILTHMNDMSQKISPLLLTILFEIWIRSNNRDLQLWKELERNSALWLDHIWLISQWRSVILALTHKVVALLYGEYKPSILIEFVGLDTSENLEIKKYFRLELEMTAETTLYFWHKFLNLMINNTRSKIPFDFKVHKELTNTMADIIDVFLNVCDFRNKENKKISIITESSASLNSLITSLNLNTQNYLDGKARLPIPSANSIFEIFGEWLFFHAGAHDSFSEFGNAPALGVLCRIICKAQGPINQSYLNSFYTVLLECFRNQNNPLILGFIISNSQNLFGLDHKGIRIFAFEDKFLDSIKKLLSDPNTLVFKQSCCVILSNIVGLNPILGNKNKANTIKSIFIDLLKTKNEPELFKRIIWSLSIIASTETQDTISDIVIALASQLQTLDYNQRPNFITLLECVSSLPYLITSIASIDAIVDVLCMNIFKNHQKNTQELLNLYLFALLNWIICFPSLFFSSLVQKKVMETVSLDFTNKTVKESAEYVVEYIKNCLLNNFDYKDQKINSGIINSKNNTQLVKHYLYNSEFILSIYEVKQEFASQNILCILRNTIGKHAWSSKLSYCIKKDEKIDFPVPTQNFCVHNSKVIDDTVGSAEDSDKISELFKSQNEILASFQSSIEESYENSINEDNNPADDGKSHRMFLSQLGLFQEDVLKDLIMIDNNSIKCISELDNVLEKDQIIVPVFFLQNYDSKIEDGNLCYSNSFVSFLNNLGILLSQDHQNIEIFSQISPFFSKYGSIVYSSDCLNELIFISPVFSSCDPKEIVTLGDTIIVWNERANDVYSHKIPIMLQQKIFFKKNIILLIPVGQHNIRIQRLGIETEGPILDEMLFSLDVLPKLLKRTLVNSKYQFSMRVKARAKRHEILKKVSDSLLADDEKARIQKILTYSFLG